MQKMQMKTHFLHNILLHLLYTYLFYIVSHLTARQYIHMYINALKKHFVNNAFLEINDRHAYQVQTEHGIPRWKKPNMTKQAFPPFLSSCLAVNTS
jgi:hypothetical protein